MLSSESTTVGSDAAIENRVQLTTFDGFRQREKSLERKLTFIASKFEKNLKFHALFNPYEMWIEQEQTGVYAVSMMYHDNCISLYNHIEKKGMKFSEQEIGDIARQLLTQVKQLHSKGIVLSQLSPASILVHTCQSEHIYSIKVSIADLPQMVIMQALSGSDKQVTGVD